MIKLRWPLVLLILYVFVLLLLTLRPAPHRVVTNYNAVPFHSILYGLRRGGPPFVINVLGNIVAFMPLGLLLPVLLRRVSLGRVALIGGLLSASIELLQLTVTRRFADVDDVLLNTLGAMLGYWLLYVLSDRDYQHFPDQPPNV